MVAGDKYSGDEMENRMRGRVTEWITTRSSMRRATCLHVWCCGNTRTCVYASLSASDSVFLSFAPSLALPSSLSLTYSAFTGFLLFNDSDPVHFGTLPLALYHMTVFALTSTITANPTIPCSPLVRRSVPFSLTLLTHSSHPLAHPPNTRSPPLHTVSGQPRARHPIGAAR